MEIIKCCDYNEMSKKTWQLVEMQITKKPDSVISLTTGTTPKGFFKLFVKAINEGLDISKLTIFNLDEFVCPTESKCSVASFMQEHFYRQIKQQPLNCFIMNGSAENIEGECQRYKNLLERYPRDIQILGLGVNGHIGANEPGVAFDSTTFCADLAESTIESSIAFFGAKNRDGVPQKMFTMGIAEIMAAMQVILFASGSSKEQALKETVCGPVANQCPASILQRHPQAIIIADEAALGTA